MRRTSLGLILAAFATVLSPGGAKAETNAVVTSAFLNDATPEEAKAFTELAETLAKRGGFIADVAMFPGKRILETVRLGHEPFCAIRYYRTAERAKFAKFTRPISQDSPFAVAVLRDKAEVVGRHRTLKSLYADESLGAPIRQEGISFGHPYLDELMSRRHVNVFNNAVPSNQIARLLASGRLDWNLQFRDGEATRTMHDMGLDIVFLPIEDMPPGGYRRIMCNQAVPDEIMGTMDATLAELFPNLQADE